MSIESNAKPAEGWLMARFFTEAYWWDFESSHRHVEAASFWGTASPSARRHQQNGWKMNPKGPQPQTLLCDLCAGSIKQFWDMVNHGHFFCEFHSGQASLELRGTWQVSRGKLEIHGGVYDLKSGRVESLGWRLPGSIELLLVAGRWWYRHGHHPHHTMVSLMCHSWGFPLLILDNYFWCVWRWPWLSDSFFFGEFLDFAWTKSLTLFLCECRSLHFWDARCRSFFYLLFLFYVWHSSVQRCFHTSRLLSSTWRMDSWAASPCLRFLGCSPSQSKLVAGKSTVAPSLKDKMHGA